MVHMIVITTIATLVVTAGVSQMKQINSAFDQWYNGLVGFHINSERILDDINFAVDYGHVEPLTVEKWMKVCWNNALEAAQDQSAVAWNDGVYATFENLKA